MKLPRDVSGFKLAQKLKKYGYNISHQTGSHIRLTTQVNGEHHITIPAHNPMKVGTLNAILRDIAQHLGMSKDELIRNVF